MKRLNWLLSLGLCALLLAIPALADEDDPGDEEKPKKVKREKKPKAPKEEKSRLRGEYAMMVSVLKLDEAAQAKIEEQVAANQAALKAWDEQHGQAYKDKRKAAKEAQDKEEKKRLMEEADQLRAERNALAEAGREKVMDLLTEEQKKTWEGFVLWRGMARRYRKADLTDEQKDAAVALCVEAAPTLPSADDAEKRTERKEALDKLGEKINGLLTPEQVEAMSKPKADKGEGGEEKPRKERKHKDKDEKHEEEDADMEGDVE
jgi:hypothetical protein